MATRTGYRPGWNGSIVTKAIAYVVGRDNDLCIICGHPGANSIEHVIPVAQRPDLEWDTSNWRAVHLHAAGHTSGKGCPIPECPCPGNIRRDQAPLAPLIAAVRGLACTCDCTCGTKTDLHQLLLPPRPALDFRTARHLWPRTSNQERIAREDARYSEAEAKRAAAAYRRGDRSEWATTGYNVDCRRRPSYRAALAEPPAPSRDW